jgi:TRAP-type transport system small permease protein
MPAAIARGYDLLLAAVRLATAAALVVLVGVVVAAVGVRYFGLFGGGLHWATEMSRFAIVWVAMLAAVLAYDQGAHLAIAFFQESLPPRPRRVVEAAIHLLGLVFLLVLAWTGLQLAQATMRQTSPALGLRMGWVYAAIPIGAGLMAVQAILFVVWPELAGRSREPEDEPAAPEPR